MCFGILLAVAQLHAQTSAALSLLISSTQPFIAEPESARIVLHIHNPTAHTIWLYRRARAKHPPEEVAQDENQPARTTGGSTVEVNLIPAETKDALAVVMAAEATVLEYVDMPMPRLIRLEAGKDYEETSIVHLQPARAEGQKPIWGKYQVTLKYAASYSNGGIFPGSLDADLWQGEVTSNAIEIELRPPLPDAVGVLSGTAVGKDLQPLPAVRVSLSDASGQLIDQRVTEADGRYSFDHLPFALYWITGRREDAAQDTVTFKHQELASALPSASVQLAFFPIETEDPKKYFHKPVLIRVFNPNHQPLSGVEIEAIYNSGDLIDDLKAVTGADGTAAMELLPGRSAVSLKRHGCPSEPDRADVAQGAGVDGFRFIYSCAKK